MSETAGVQSVSELDLTKYVGQWFEIGRLPLKWEDHNASCITAHYALAEDGSVTVDNRCFDENGEPTQSLGRALPVDGEPGQLTVSFLPKLLRWLPFTEGDYWVLKIDPEYTVSLVGTPDRKNLWLLARDWDLPEAIKAEYLTEARAQGFDLSAWITPAQDGQVVSDELLNDL